MSITLTVPARRFADVHRAEPAPDAAHAQDYFYRWEWADLVMRSEGILVTANFTPSTVRAAPGWGRTASTAPVSPLRWLWRSRTGLPGDSVQQPRGNAAAEPRGPNQLLVRRPMGADCVEVDCLAGGELASVRIWFITARLGFNADGPLDPNHENLAGPLWHAGSAPARCGFFQRTDRTRDQTQYGRVVEIIGLVEPADVPARFYFARQIIRGGGVYTRNGHVERDQRAGWDDTTAREWQDRTLSISVPDNGRQVGKVFDIDAPGGMFHVGVAHGDRDEMEVVFEEILAIGDPPLDEWPVNDPHNFRRGTIWRYTERQGLGMSAPLTWYCRNTVQVTHCAADNHDGHGEPPSIEQVRGAPNEANWVRPVRVDPRPTRATVQCV